jgi:hypothetical protein
MRTQEGEHQVQKLMAAWRAGEVYAAAVLTTEATTADEAWVEVRARCLLGDDGERGSESTIRYKIALALVCSYLKNEGRLEWLLDHVRAGLTVTQLQRRARPYVKVALGGVSKRVAIKAADVCAIEAAIASPANEVVADSAQPPLPLPPPPQLLALPVALGERKRTADSLNATQTSKRVRKKLDFVEQQAAETTATRTRGSGGGSGGGAAASNGRAESSANDDHGGAAGALPSPGAGGGARGGGAASQGTAAAGDGDGGVGGLGRGQGGQGGGAGYNLRVRPPTATAQQPAPPSTTKPTTRSRQRTSSAPAGAAAAAGAAARRAKAASAPAPLSAALAARLAAAREQLGPLLDAIPAAPLENPTPEQWKEDLFPYLCGLAHVHAAAGGCVVCAPDCVLQFVPVDLATVEYSTYHLCEQDIGLVFGSPPTSFDSKWKAAWMQEKYLK